MMVDVGKHPCAAAKDASSCQLLRDPRGRPLCTHADTCSSEPCSTCQACLDSANGDLFASAAFKAAITAVEVRQQFGKWCSGQGYSTALCARVGERIQGSAEGNLGKRAGAICSLLGSCSGNAAANSCSGSGFTANSTSGAAALTGNVDQCTVEGVQGGAELYLSSRPVPVQQVPELDLCLRDIDCPRAGQVCKRQGAGTLVCGCSNGVDVCQTYGTCISYCQVPSVQLQMAAVNRLVGCQQQTSPSPRLRQ
jgi:hypothetical protein